MVIGFNFHAGLVQEQLHLHDAHDDPRSAADVLLAVDRADVWRRLVSHAHLLDRARLVLGMMKTNNQNHRLRF